MKLLSFQPFSIYDCGGGCRILRRLYAGHEEDIISLAVADAPLTQNGELISELVILATPIRRHWYRSYLRGLMDWTRERVFGPLTAGRIQRAARSLSCDVIHSVAHGPFSASLIKDKSLGRREHWVSFHDHHETSGLERSDAARLWAEANSVS
jgi:hypothetical protein